MNMDTLEQALEETKDLRLKDGLIISPGKFEGERWDIIYWYSIFLDGCCDDSGDAWDSIIVDEEERILFGLAEDAAYAILWHSVQGFVGLNYITLEEFDTLEDSTDA